MLVLFISLVCYSYCLVLILCALHLVLLPLSFDGFCLMFYFLYAAYVAPYLFFLVALFLTMTRVICLRLLRSFVYSLLCSMHFKY